MSAMWATNPPVARALWTLSFGRPARLPPENDSTGGEAEAIWKYENGARLRRPCSSTVEIQPIGRGTTVPVRSLYRSRASSPSRSKRMPEDTADVPRPPLALGAGDALVSQGCDATGDGRPPGGTPLGVPRAKTSPAREWTMKYNKGAILRSIEQPSIRDDHPEFDTGDTVRVDYKVVEGNRSRIQSFEGVVIARKNGKGARASMTVRKVSFGEGVERVFPLSSPLIDKIAIVRRGRTRRSKLYYLRELRGKASRLKVDVRRQEADRASARAARDAAKNGD